MQVAIPHQLGKEEARRRLRTNSHRMGEAIPGGMTQVETTWPSEDRMVMAITAMGQSLNAHIDIEDAQVTFFVDLPPALGFIQPIVEGAIRQQSHKLLAPPSA
jgi:hypothetical protein